MSNTVIKVENLSKQYRLGTVGTGTLSHDLNRWWHKVRGKEDPYLKIGESNDRASKGESEYVWALKDINFEVKQGEVLGIIGKNGAGKSTLLKILSKVTGPTTGSIKAKGRIASLLEVGTGFHPELTGRENIYLNGTILGMTKREVDKKLDEIVEFAGVARYLDTPVKRYSSGMTVRLGFAVAAHLEPEILVVDEVLAVGDAEFQKKAIGKMQEVSREGGRTVLFVSHNMASVEALCTKTILLSNGRIAFSGAVSECIDYYLQVNSKKERNTLSQNREGNGRVRIYKIKFLDNQLKDISTPITGKPLYLEISIEADGDFNLSALQLDIGINDEKGNRVGWMSLSTVKKRPSKIIEDKKMKFYFEKFPLISGTYSLNIFVTYFNEVSDWVKEEFFFDVLEGDYYGVGKNIKPMQTRYLLDYKVV